MNIKTFLNDWIALSNNFDTAGYLEKFHEHAVLDDPSVGSKFTGHKGIRGYFESYFIGYNTHTEVRKLKVMHPDHAHLEVEFTGSFPQGKIGGTFDFTFQNEKIATLRAELI